MTYSIAEQLIKLREMHSLTLNEVGEHVGVSMQTIQKYEQNLKSPSTSTIYNLAKLFTIHPSELFRVKSVDLVLSNIKFREEDHIKEKEVQLDFIKQVCRDYLERFMELKGLLNESLEFTNPLEGMEDIETKKDIEKAAKILRKKWRLGNSPIYNVTRAVEDEGIAVVEVKVNNSFSGLSGIANEELQFMVINKNSADVTRKRFTILHELGHIVLKFKESITEAKTEFLCDHFAGAVLLVDDVVAQELGKHRNQISLVELRRIKEKYGASIQTIIIRAKQIEYISESDCNKWWDLYESWKLQTNNSYFGTYSRTEKPTLLNSLINKGISEQRISWSKAAELTKSTEDELKTLFNEPSFIMN